MFNKGTPKGFTKCKPIGDHTSPRSWTGTRAASKKVQKIPKKNINSLKTKRTTPNLKPSITKKLWKPLIPSKVISLDHKKETKIKTIKQKKKKKTKPNLKKTTKELVKPNTIKKTKYGKLDKLKIWKLWKKKIYKNLWHLKPIYLNYNKYTKK